MLLCAYLVRDVFECAHVLLVKVDYMLPLTTPPRITLEFLTSCSCLFVVVYTYLCDSSPRGVCTRLIDCLCIAQYLDCSVYLPFMYRYALHSKVWSRYRDMVCVWLVQNSSSSVQFEVYCLFVFKIMSICHN